MNHAAYQFLHERYSEENAANLRATEHNRFRSTPHAYTHALSVARHDLWQKKETLRILPDSPIPFIRDQIFFDLLIPYVAHPDFDPTWMQP